MSWAALVLAGVCETIGVLAISRWHRDRNGRAIALLVGAFGISFALLTVAMRTIPMGTAYAVWTGIGAAGGAALGMLNGGESRSPRRILFIAMVIGSAVGLKLIGS